MILLRQPQTTATRLPDGYHECAQSCKTNRTVNCSSVEEAQAWSLRMLRCAPFSGCRPILTSCAKWRRCGWGSQRNETWFRDVANYFFLFFFSIRDLSGARPHSRCRIASYLAASSKTIFLIANDGDTLPLYCSFAHELLFLPLLFFLIFSVICDFGIDGSSLGCATKRASW